MCAVAKPRRWTAEILLLLLANPSLRMREKEEGARVHCKGTCDGGCESCCELHKQAPACLSLETPDRARDR